MKKALREQSLKMRDGLAETWRQEASVAIGNTLTSLTLWQRQEVIMTFLSIGSEVETAPIVERAWQEGKTVVVPKVSGKELLCCRIGSWEELTPGAFSVPEPKAPKVLSPGEIGLVLVPGLAFDKRGGRLGYGAGFYDRFLSQTKAVRLGLAFAVQIVPSLPQEETDCPIDGIITEGEIIMARRERK